MIEISTNYSFPTTAAGLGHCAIRCLVDTEVEEALHTSVPGSYAAAAQTGMYLRALAHAATVYVTAAEQGALGITAQNPLGEFNWSWLAHAHDQRLLTES